MRFEAHRDWPGLLRSVRLAHRLTQKQAALEVNACLLTWKCWEAGRRVPAGVFLERLVATWNEIRSPGVVVSHARVLLPLIYDESDYVLVEGSRWSFAADNYPARRRGRVLEYLHRLLVGDNPGMEIDHINGNRLDVRRCNLRHVTHKENGANQRINKRNKSGYRGVFYRSDRRKWAASVGMDGKQRILGYFDTPEEASVVASAYRLKHMKGAVS